GAGRATARRSAIRHLRADWCARPGPPPPRPSNPLGGAGCSPPPASPARGVIGGTRHPAGLIKPQKVGWVERVVRGVHYRIAIGFHEVRDRPLFPLYFSPPHCGGRP